MDRQLVKVAKELNVGTETIVEFLNAKGFDIQNKPIAKVTEDMYAQVQKKFASERDIKEKAEKITFGTRPMGQPTQTPAKPTSPPPSVSAPTEKPKVSLTPNVAETPVSNVVERPKISLTPVGKIELKPEKPKIELKPEPKPEPKVETKQEPKVELKPEPKTEQKPAQKSEQKPEQRQPAKDQSAPRHNDQRRDNNNRGNNDGQRHNRDGNRGNEQRRDNANRDNSNRDNNRQGGGNSNNNNRGGNANNNNNNRGNRNDDRSKPNVPPPPPPVKVETPPPPPPTPVEVLRAEAPQLRGLKIQGKIDLDKYLKDEKDANANRRERERTRRRERNQKPATPAAGTAGAGSSESASDANKRRRKRKKVTPDGTPNTTGGQNAGQGGGQNRPAGQGGGQNRGGQGGGQNRPAGQGGGQNRGGQGGGQNRPAGQGGGQNRGGQGGGYNRTGGNNRPGGQANTPNVPTEISQAEIEAKIKETMARLNIGGKNKGQKLRRDKREKIREREELRQNNEANEKLQVTEFISVADLASLIDVSPTDVIKTCMQMGIFVAINQRLDAEVIEVIASEYGKEVVFITAEEQLGAVLEDAPDDPATLKPRAPIVTVMGHVDHGKTSLLDYIRRANVASGESGGITQHIGAYEVKLENDRRITFLDTPGHEAFTAMRARGAKVTDVAIIIIAADDNIMPQTREAISHAQAAGVPIVFAINKIDKPGADPNRIKSELAQMNLMVEEWGGKYQSQDISAKQGIGVPELLEKILLEAELLDVKANPDKLASGTVIEASLDKGRGYVTKMLVQAGTLNIGDAIVAGEYAGKIKAMFNERGQKVTKAGPSTPTLVLGLSGAPQAGERFKVMETEGEAREIAVKRAQIAREQSARATKRISIEEIGRRLALGTFKELNIIIKGDFDGSVEALSDSLLKQSHATVQVRVIHKGVGAITESDIMLASASDAIIIGFQVRPSPNARVLAEREGVQIKTYSIIYEAIAEIRAAIEGMLEPTKEEQVMGTAEVREVYKISKIGTVAGCYVQEGKITRNAFIRIIRQGIVVFPVREGQNATLGSLKRFKDDVKEVKNAFEFGCTIDNYNDIEVGDTIEAYEIIEVKQKLK